MSASIDVAGLTQFSGNLRRAISGDLQKALVKNIQSNEGLILREMHSHAHTRIQKRAVGSVKATRTSVGLDVAGGQGGGLGAVLFNGGEYGGRKSRKVVYATHSPRGKAYIVRRRTTMQFLPNLGREGYFFWPTIRNVMPKLAKQQDEIVGKVLG